jgi:hypothetical protein
VDGVDVAPTAPHSLSFSLFSLYTSLFTIHNQIEIALEDQEKTTFTCPFGTFAYQRKPFGLCNAPATFKLSNIIRLVIIKHA